MESWTIIKSNKTHNQIRRIIRLKPVLSYVEMHIVDHCNLNCKGCSHFSPIADELFMDIDEFTSDLKQLSRLVSNIEVIRLMGGEPLLHPNITDFIRSTKFLFPSSDLHIVSNGILLPTMTNEFWNTCRQNSICIDLTIYPPFVEKEKTWVEIVRSNRVKVRIAEKPTFSTIINSRGDSDTKRVSEKCIFPGFAMVRQGRLYHCWMPALVHYFNRQYDELIPNKDYLEIYDPKITGWDLLSQIEKGSETCKYCTSGWHNVPFFQWTKSTLDKAEWDVASFYVK
jgi:hypothetical protein